MGSSIIIIVVQEVHQGLDAGFVMELGVTFTVVGEATRFATRFATFRLVPVILGPAGTEFDDEIAQALTKGQRLVVGSFLRLTR